MLVCTAAQMRELDRTTIEDYGVPGVVLMESAGRGVVEVIASLRSLDGLRVLVLCGRGNNGGDGFVIARHLMNRGARVRTYLIADRAKIGGDAHDDDNDPRPGQTRQGADAGHPADETVNHLRRHFGRVFADPFGRHAMVAGHGDDRLPRHRGTRAATSSSTRTATHR